MISDTTTESMNPARPQGTRDARVGRGVGGIVGGVLGDGDGVAGSGREAAEALVGIDRLGRCEVLEE